MKNKIYRTSLALLCAVLTMVFWLRQSASADEPISSRLRNVETAPMADRLSQAFRDSADRASPGLVTVYSMRGSRMTPPWQKMQAARGGELLPRNERYSGHMQPRSFTDDQGSGIVIDDKGLILTCNHIVAAADALLVVLPDGRSFEPVEVRGDPETDLAVIRIEGAGKLDEVRLGDSDAVRPGDWAVTLANPFDLKDSLSVGIVSATNRRVPGGNHPLIQFDAATNPGSSGGALLNLQGEVIGVITGSFGLGERFQGLGMAVPIDVAKSVVSQLEESEGTQRAYLGCQTKPLSPAVARKLGLPVAGGLYVENVEPGSSAYRAGLKEGDVITSVGKQAIENRFDDEHAFDALVPGTSYSLMLVRAGKAIKIAVRTDEAPHRENSSEGTSEPSPNPSAEYFDHQLGLGLDSLSPRFASELGFPQGTEGSLVSHVEIGGLAYKEGIAAGMVVRRVDDFSISDVESYKYALSNHPDAKPLLMLIQTNESKHLVVFESVAD